MKLELLIIEIISLFILVYIVIVLYVLIVCQLLSWLLLSLCCRVDDLCQVAGDMMRQF